MTESFLIWLQNWYESQCDGDWEHGYRVHINTIDNPGWHVSIGLSETELEGLEITYKLEESSESDWYDIAILKNQYDASGDPSKLTLLSERFRELVEHQRAGTLAEYLERTYPGRWEMNVVAASG